MKVIVAESAGFCWGVRRAVEKARGVLANGKGPVFTDGPLIHNRQMIEQLRQEGILAIATPAQAQGGTLLIRAHGIPPERRAVLAAAATLIDATCPDVARIQGLIRRHARGGFTILIYGDRGHAEVIGLLGFAEGRGTVLADADDVDGLPDLDRVCLVSQSTQVPCDYERVAARVQARFRTTVVLDTICESTKKRQTDLTILATQVDALVVVGGRDSANTMRLVELARALKPTFHIETADDLEPGDFQHVRTVGVTAGASTPAFVISEVRAKLESMPPDARTP